VTNGESQFTDLLSTSPERVKDWIDDRFPGAAPPQWWQAAFESAETDLSPLKAADQSARSDALQRAAELVVLSVDRGVESAAAAYWILRFAASALRIKSAVNAVPDLLTPDGSVAWALEQIPLSREAAIRAARARRDEHRRAGDSFYAPVGTPFDSTSFRDDMAQSALVSVERVLTALAWISDHVSDPRLRHETEEWLLVKEQL
jgi:hypothetical protein